MNPYMRDDSYAREVALEKKNERFSSREVSDYLYLSRLKSSQLQNLQNLIAGKTKEQKNMEQNKEETTIPIKSKLIGPPEQESIHPYENKSFYYPHRELMALEDNNINTINLTPDIKNRVNSRNVARSIVGSIIETAADMGAARQINEQARSDQLASAGSKSNIFASSQIKQDELEEKQASTPEPPMQIGGVRRSALDETKMVEEKHNVQLLHGMLMLLEDKVASINPSKRGPKSPRTKETRERIKEDLTTIKNISSKLDLPRNIKRDVDLINASSTPKYINMVKNNLIQEYNI